MTKILQSFNPFAFALPEVVVHGKILPAVELPKSRYHSTEVYINGPRKGFPARSVMEVTELEQERIGASPQIMAMFAKGSYRWLDHVPESMKTTEDVVAELRAKNEALMKQILPGSPAAPAVDEEKLEIAQANLDLQSKLSGTLKELEELRSRGGTADDEIRRLQEKLAEVEAENRRLNTPAPTPAAPAVDDLTGEIIDPASAGGFKFDLSGQEENQDSAGPVDPVIEE